MSSAEEQDSVDETAPIMAQKLHTKPDSRASAGVFTTNQAATSQIRAVTATTGKRNRGKTPSGKSAKSAKASTS